MEIKSNGISTSRIIITIIIIFMISRSESLVPVCSRFMRSFPFRETDFRFSFRFFFPEPHGRRRRHHLHRRHYRPSPPTEPAGPRVIEILPGPLFTTSRIPFYGRRATIKDGRVWKRTPGNAATGRTYPRRTPPRPWQQRRLSRIRPVTITARCRRDQ